MEYASPFGLKLRGSAVKFQQMIHMVGASAKTARTVPGAPQPIMFFQNIVQIIIQYLHFFPKNCAVISKFLQGVIQTDSVADHPESVFHFLPDQISFRTEDLSMFDFAVHFFQIGEQDVVIYGNNLGPGRNFVAAGYVSGQLQETVHLLVKFLNGVKSIFAGHNGKGQSGVVERRILQPIVIAQIPGCLISRFVGTFVQETITVPRNQGILIPGTAPGV